ncbi:hypothetical protein A8L45_18575 [Veronia pacifica]|uniref:Uncharacterized protein n=1 Tax=Veronia pacifica TaxID=1080227 RepID=A0A1C3ECG8_9GAMM|nr:hypothetical protein A8L45_18575 [Veronia pacifica]
MYYSFNLPMEINVKNMGKLKSKLYMMLFASFGYLFIINIQTICIKLLYLKITAVIINNVWCNINA